jgi:CHAT domain-containing protein
MITIIRTLSFLTIILISSVTSLAQVMANNRLYAKIRRESYDNAINFAKRHIEKHKGKKRYYRKTIPMFLGLGMVYKKTGNYAEAEKNYYEAYRILNYKKAHKMRMSLPDYDVLDELGLMYLETGNFDEARDLIRRSLKYREKRFAKTNLLRYRSHLAYGNYFYHTHNLDSAYYYLAEYVYYIRNSNHTSKQELNRYADTYAILADLEIERNNIELAIRHAKKNKKWQHHRWTKKEAGRNNINKIHSLDLLSRCFRLANDTTSALHYSRKAFELYEERIQTETHHMIPLLVNRALIYWDMGNFEGAQQYFIKATELQNEFIEKNFSSLTEYEKENFYSALRKNFDYLNAFAVDRINAQSNTDSIFSTVYDFHIATKAIILNESNKMLSILQATTDEDLKGKFAEWRKEKNEMAKKMVVQDFDENDPTVKELKGNINRLEKEMAQKTALFAVHGTQTKWQDIRKSLKPGQVAIEIVRTPVYARMAVKSNVKSKLNISYLNTLTDSVVYMVMIVKPDTKTAPERLVIANGKELESRAFRFYQNSNLLKLKDKYSYNYFWKPIADKLSNATEIFVSADGVYNLINLWLLEDPVSGKRLIDKVDIINVTNTRIVAGASPGDFKVRNAILVGRPSYSDATSVQQVVSDTASLKQSRDVGDIFRDGVADLPGTEKEVKDISTFLNKNNITTELLLNERASEDALKKIESKEIIHIATHGFFDPRQSGRNPMVRSGLLLAGVTSRKANKKEDGILTAYEASNLDLKDTRLVVLSACETGLGEIKSGEGVYGLQRAFEVAGVESILMSMWKVSDQATQELMVTFYDELLKSKNVHEAFKISQLKIREKYPETYYWGAFKLIGY